MSKAPADTIDLDALRRAKADGGPDRKTFTFGGETYEVASRLPLYVGGLMADGEIIAAMRLWLGDAQSDRLSRTDFDQDDMFAALESLYGIDMGELGGSAD